MAGLANMASNGDIIGIVKDEEKDHVAYNKRRFTVTNINNQNIQLHHSYWFSVQTTEYCTAISLCLFPTRFGLVRTYSETSQSTRECDQ